ncbi:uncharacterized protein isoform X4 [Salmo salar]|uniref:Uncharacterized protein isoform X4 n=1 Tax=Salmo salar TaxID=8030 RepID=A0ABM3C9R6_SALSA|nr:uncharacterized protein LOC106613538 isoform X4 [Salmo salar]
MFILYGKDGERRYKKAIARKKNQTGQEVHYLLQTNGGASVCTLGHQQPGAHFSAAAAQIGALRKTRPSICSQTCAGDMSGTGITNNVM